MIGRGKRPAVATALCLALLLLISIPSAAQDLAFPADAAGSDQAFAEALPGLAEQATAIYAEPDRLQYLSTLFRLQTVAGRYPEAVATLRELIELRRATDPASAARLLPFETVSDESIADAGEPLRIRWLSGSYLDVPTAYRLQKKVRDAPDGAAPGRSSGAD